MCDQTPAAENHGDGGLKAKESENGGPREDRTRQTVWADFRY